MEGRTLSFRKKNIGDDGISFDFLTSKQKLKELVGRLDHILINDLEEFKKINPTSENIARWFYHYLKESVHTAGGKVDRIVIHEGPENLAFFEPTSLYVKSDVDKKTSVA